MSKIRKSVFLLIFASLFVFAACQVETSDDDIIVQEPDINETDMMVEEQEDVQETVDLDIDRTIEVEGFGRTFEPNLIEVEVGETIEFVFTNTGGTHDFVIPSLGIGTEILNEGQTDSFVHTFEEAGTIEFICSVGNHAAEGMTGQIIVS